MNPAMSIITDRMQALLVEINATSEALETACSSAQDAWKNNWLAAAQRISIVSLHSKVQLHLNSGKQGLNQAIQSYETTDAAIIQDINKGWTVSVPGTRQVPTTVINSDKSVEVKVDTEQTNLVYQINKDEVIKLDSVTKRVLIEGTPNLPRAPQIQEVDKNGNYRITYNKDGTVKEGSGRCNVSAVTTLLNRRYALDTAGRGDKWYTPTDVLKANGCTGIKDHGYVSGTKRNGQQKIEYTGGTGNWYNGKKYTNGETTYYTVANTKTSVKDTVVSEYGGSYEKYIAAQLDKHPEGICIRSSAKTHVITVTDYSIDKDGIHLYVDDPVETAKGNSRVDIKDTYIWTKNFWDGLDPHCAVTYLSTTKG